VYVPNIVCSETSLYKSLSSSEYEILPYFIIFQCSSLSRSHNSYYFSLVIYFQTALVVLYSPLCYFLLNNTFSYHRQTIVVVSALDSPLSIHPSCLYMKASKMLRDFNDSLLKKLVGSVVVNTLQVLFNTILHSDLP